MAYIAIIFLPMMYDYFFDEEYCDDNENISYIGLILEYIMSSFGEAFGGVLNIPSTALLRLVRLNQEL